MSRLLGLSVAKSTQASYDRALSLFLSFIAQHFQQYSLPGTVQQLAAFIAQLSLLGRAPATIATYVSAISFKHKLSLLPDPANNFLIKKLLEGTKRAGRGRQDTRRPVTYDILVRFLGALPLICSNDFETALFKAAFALAFFAFLRVGEFTARTKNADSADIIQRHDVIIMPNLIQLIIRHAKNNQHNKPVQIEIVGLGAQHPHCPVKIISAYVSMLPDRGPGPLFQHFDRSPLTRFQFKAILKKAVTFTGLDSAHYKTHSFRIGGATSCALSGVSEDQIKLMGRWSSSAYRSYIRPPTQVMAKTFIPN